MGHHQDLQKEAPTGGRSAQHNSHHTSDPTPEEPIGSVCDDANEGNNPRSEKKRLFDLQAKFALLGAELKPLSSGGLLVTASGFTQHLDSLDAAEKLLVRARGG